MSESHRADDPVRLIAFYLPQFHPIPENDLWWGRGFTEWTNVARARPLFRGHYQPHMPADLGFYDLRLPETRAAQAELARDYGITAFCYYHYWFGGKRLLERPFNDVLTSGEPDFPFCLCWANQTWTGVWHGAPNRILMEQTYPGIEDHRRHFDFLLSAFLDKRYLTVEGKPLFMVYEPTGVPDVLRVTDLWRTWAIQAGLKGLHLVGWQHGDSQWDPEKAGFDAVVGANLPLVWFTWAQFGSKVRRYVERRLGRPAVYRYDEVALSILGQPDVPGLRYPCLVPNWDNTPRSGANGLVLHRSTPARFGAQVDLALARIRAHSGEQRLIFVKSWNEWAEGNHLEPDQEHGRAYLEVIRAACRRRNRAAGAGALADSADRLAVGQPVAQG